MSRAPLLVVAGEASGDRAAAAVLRHTQGATFGFGGQALRAAGAELVGDLRHTTGMGLTLPLARAARLVRVFQRLVALARERRPAVALLVNYTEFNLRLARSLRPDLVHGHLVHGDVYGAVAAVASRATLVSTKHNDDPFRAGPFRHVERLLARRTARIVCITDALRRFSIDRVGLPADRLVVVHYGLDEPPAAWGDPGGPALEPDVPVLVAVCRLEEQKGLDVAIRALALLAGEHGLSAPHLVVLGEGTLRGRLESLARDEGVAERVHLPGRVGDVAWWVRRAAVLVHPARWEGFGLALLEGMLCARPVVASRVSSVPEIVEDGVTGLLVPPDDAIALGAALARLLRAPEEAEAMGRAGYERARTAFSVAAMADRTLAVYREALPSASS